MPKTPPLTYELLLSEYRLMGEEDFGQRYSSPKSLRDKVILLLADRENHGDVPLGLLRGINPELSDALRAWSAGDYEKIRKAQESNSVVAGSMADKLQRNFEDLPLWKKEATHYSKVSFLYKLLKDGGEFTLKASMSCSAPGFRPAEVSVANSTLVFKNLRTARLVGALTTTMLEHEVMLPAGATFTVVDVDHAKRLITLEEN